MSDVQITLGDQSDAQIISASAQDAQVTVAVPGIQGPVGLGFPSGGTTNQVLFKQSNTNYDAVWGFVTSSMIGDLQIVDADVSASAAIAGTKISPNFGSQNVVTTGTSTAASFIPTSSTAPTNGVYLPSANSVALSTNGTGRLFISSAGLVGVGTSTPGYLVTAATSADGVDGVSVESPSLNGVIRLRADGTNGNAIRVGGVGAQGNTLRFLVGSDAERMRITSAGLVGIGTSSPQTTVQAVGAIESRAANTYRGIRIEAQDGGFQILKAHNYLGVGYNSQLQFQTMDGTSVTTAMTINGPGQVGIGTTSPAYTLDVRRSSAGAVVGFTGSTDGGRALTFNSADVGIFLGAQWTRDILSGSGIHAWAINGTERLRIDSSGRLLVGTSSARSNFFPSAGWFPTVQIETATNGGRGLSIVNNRTDNNGPQITFGKANGSAIGSADIVLNNDNLGAISFTGADGTNLIQGARIEAAVDGTPGANDMPGRIVLSTTSDGAASPTERLRITNDGVLGYNQAAPVAVDATATLTVANLKTRIITSTTAAAVTMTLPTGTLTEGGFSGLYNNFTFEWTVINTGATNAVTVQGGTGHTLVGSGTVAAGVSGRFASRRTAANTFVTYRLS